MNSEEIREIQELTLLNGGTSFPYFKNRYALLLLAWAVGGEGKTIAEIKRSSYAGLLNKPIIKKIVSQCGSGRLTAGDLYAFWPSYSDQQIYKLTLGNWASENRKQWRYKQLTRPGGNLVIQLNFTGGHDEAYKRLLKKERPFRSYGHPVADEHNTLAWARLDLDLETGEGLIEEIQTDWIRFVQRDARWWQSVQETNREKISRRFDWKIENIEKYYDHVLRPHVGTWSEAMLSAALWYLRNEVGLHTIYYHTFESGNRLKNINSRWRTPPRSLYTKLPRSFGFKETDEVPEFLQTKTTHRPTRRKLRDEPVRFYKLNV